MQILLANAKMMRTGCGSPQSVPHFLPVAESLAMEMASLSIDELERKLDCSHKIAAQNLIRYQNFFEEEKLPALLAYSGQAYKHLRAETLTQEDLNFAQEHLWITSFLYGLLRPLDAIVPYRMEHCVSLTATHNRPVNRFWKNFLTDFLINSVKADDGTLLHLSTEEYEHLFHWERVRREVKVIQPLFYVQTAKGLKIQSVWAKSCRGAMARFAITHRINTPQALEAFSHEGFKYSSQLGEEAYPHYVRQ